MPTQHGPITTLPPVLTADQQAKKDQAVTSVTTAMEDAVAAQLKENYQYLQAAYPKLDSPEKMTDEGFRKAAREAISDRQVVFNGRDGHPLAIKLEDIDKKIADLKRPAMDIAAKVPTRKQVEAIAKATGDGVAESFSGSLEGGVGLREVWDNTSIGGMAGLVWNGMTGQPQSTETTRNIAVGVGNTTRSNVERQLAELSAKEPAIRQMLATKDSKTGQTALEQIGEGVQHTVLQAAHIEPVTPPIDRVAMTQIANHGDEIREGIEKKIKEDVEVQARLGMQEEIDKKFKEIRGGTSKAFDHLTGIDWLDGILGAIIGFFAKFIGPETMRSIAVNMGKCPSDKQVDEAAQITAQTVSTVMASPEMERLRQEHPGDSRIVANEVTARVQTALSARHDLALDENAIKEMAEKTGNGVAAKLDDIPLVGTPTRPVADPIASAAARGGVNTPRLPVANDDTVPGAQSPGTTPAPPNPAAAQSPAPPRQTAAR